MMNLDVMGFSDDLMPFISDSSETAEILVNLLGIYWWNELDLFDALKGSTVNTDDLLGFNGM